MMSAIKSPESNEGYNIIKICHMENVQGDEMKERAKQLFSLHTKKSLRLQRLGSWIAYEDQNTGSTYYYNHKTGEGQWNMPTSVSTLMKKSSSLSSKSSKSVLVSYIFIITIIFIIICYYFDYNNFNFFIIFLLNFFIIISKFQQKHQ